MTDRTDYFAFLEQNGDLSSTEKKSCLGITRRTFIKGAGITLAAMAAPPLSFASNSRSRVAMVRRPTIEAAVRKAIEKAGGLEEILEGQTVVIKPNLVVPASSAGDRVTTHPEVLRAVIRCVKERTAASNITVGESSAFNYVTLDVAEATGIAQVCRDEGVALFPFETDSHIYFTHPNFTNFTTPIQIPESLSTFDHFINVPTCKNHSWSTVGSLKAGGLGFFVPDMDPPLPDDFVLFYARFTLCMKNFVGLMPFNPADPNSLGRVRSGLHAPDIGQKIAELNLCVPNITMNVIDCITALVNDGPAGDLAQFTNPDIIIASKDRVACDSVGLALLKHQAKLVGITVEQEPYIEESVWQAPQIMHAGQVGLGKANPDDIKVINAGVEEFEYIMDEWV